MRILLAAMALTIASEAPSFAANDSTTLTRAELGKLTPQQLSARLLSMLAKQTMAAEIRTYVSPVTPTPPWLYRAEVDLPASYDASLKLCHIERLVVDFAPLDGQAAQAHMFDANYDVPVKISGVDMMHQFADPAPSTDCAAIPKDNYFIATDIGSAAQAVDAFSMFREAVNKPGSKVLTCNDFTSGGSCKLDELKSVTRFESVLSLQEDRHQDASIARTIVLSVSNPYGEAKTELWLTVVFGKDVRLERAELRRLWADPIP